MKKSYIELKCCVVIFDNDIITDIITTSGFTIGSTDPNLKGSDDNICRDFFS